MKNTILLSPAFVIWVRGISLRRHIFVIAQSWQLKYSLGGARAVAHCQSAYLTCVRHWVRSVAPHISK